MRQRFLRSSVAFIVGLAGCTVGPTHRPPDTPISPTWSELPESGVTPQPTAAAQWWATLQDPILNALVEQAVKSNLDLRIAQGRIREARASRGVVAADAWPTVNVAGEYSRIRRSENITGSSAFGLGGGGLPGASRQFGELETDLFQNGFDASWEIDVFGRVRRAVEAAEADIAAAEENRRDVLVSLLAEVARNYVDLRGLQRQLAVADRNIVAQQDAAELTAARYDAGLTSELDVAQARALLATTQSQIPALDSAAKQAIHRLGVLLGQEPGALLARLSPAAPIPMTPVEVAVGLPAELLRRRPDVRRAERELAAATARVGVATADLYPRLTLTGIVGLQSADLVDLAENASRFWAAGPIALAWPLFDAGRIRSTIEVQNARQEQAIAFYERTVLIAVEDVENALVAFVREQVRRQALARAVDANRRAVDLASEQYTSGLADFLNVLESQRSLYTAEDQLTLSERAVVSNLIALYKALGGGWASVQ